MKDSDHSKKFGTFPTKPTPIKPMCNNKFQRLANLHKEQEKSGEFVHRKIHFGGTPRLQYREGGAKYRKPQEEGEKKFGKFGDKSPKNLKGNKRFEKEKSGKKKNLKKKQRGDPVKGTSTEYVDLANSDEDDDVVDVTDMLEKEEEPDPEPEADNEIPLINSSKNLKKLKSAKATSKFSTGNRFNALGEYEEVETLDEPPKKKKKVVQRAPESDDEDSAEDPEGSGDDAEVDSEDGDEDEDEEERLKFRSEIAAMPLGKVKEMKEKLGIKLFNKTYFGTSETEKQKKIDKKMAREQDKFGQHRPKEISSKRPVSAFRNVYGEHEQGQKKKRWDPRFDSRAGDFKEVCFDNNYQFLDEIRTGEMDELRNQYNTARGEGDEKKAARFKNTLQRMETREKTRAEKRRQQETRKELHDDNIQRMLNGEAPIFRTKAQVRRIDAEKKFDELKKTNKLDKYLQKKAKKESAKQKKARPPFEGYGYQ